MDAFKFPHEREEENAKASEAEDQVEFEIEGDEKPEIEVVDDTPEKDKGKEPTGKTPEILTDEELDQHYGVSAKKRISQLQAGYHEERRIKEAALREKDEALRLAQAIIEENKKLKGTLSQNQQLALDQAKKAAATELEQVKRKYKDAYEAGDADAIVAAQEELASVKFRAERLASFKPPVQPAENDVQISQPPVQQAPAPDSRAVEWKKNNSWFGKDEEMTSFALGVHTKLVNSGVDPTSDEYYEALNGRLRKVFPEQFAPDESADAPPSQRKKTNVAPVSRSVAPKKITLTATQVSIAKRLGVPLELYAKKVAEEMRK